jgi:hypothetical protein
VPLKPQVTAVFEVPVTLAVKSCMPAVETEALVGVMLKTATAPIGAGPDRSVTVALLVFVGSVLLLTATTITAFAVTCCGAV